MHRSLAERLHAGEGASVFDANYYRTGCGPDPYLRNDQWLAFFSGIATQIVRSLKPRRVFDAGCAMGMLVESFWDLGVEAYGVDISPYAISQVRRDMQAHCRVGSITEPLQGGPYDVITCIEVVEHMPEAEARAAIGNLTRATDRIIFSSSPSDFTEPTHINVQPLIYWMRLFAESGFWPDLTFEADFIAAHAMLFARGKPQPFESGDVLALLSQKLRFREALNERETRIGRLNAELATHTGQVQELQAAADARERAVEELAAKARAEADRAEAERARLEVALGRAEGERALLGEAVRRAEGERARLHEALESSSAEQARLHSALESSGAEQARLHSALESSGAEQARLHSALDEAEAALVSARSAAAEEAAALVQRSGQLESALATAESERDDARRELAGTARRAAELAEAQAELARTASGYRNELAGLRRYIAELHASPGWRLISRYRGWLAGALQRSRFVRRVYTPVIQWFIRKKLPPEAGYTPAPLETAASGETGFSEADRIETTLDYNTWIQLSEPGRAQLELQKDLSNSFSYRPKISVVAPVYKVPLEVLKECADSVLEQTYGNWELCVAHGDPGGEPARAYLEQLAAADPRVRVVLLDVNLGISGNSNKALELATGEFIALLDHDDTLAPTALFEAVQKLNEDPRIDFLYSDKDQLSADGEVRLDPLFKPQWSPEVLFGANYLTHLCVIRKSLIDAVGGWRPETDGAQDWDLFLRVTEKAGRIALIPKVLYHWRQIATSVSACGLDAKPYAAAAQLRSLNDAFERRGRACRATFTGSGLVRIQWNAPKPLVSVIVAFSDGAVDWAAHCEGLLRSAEYPELEAIALVTHAQAAGRQATDRRIRSVACETGAAIEERLNAAVHASSGEILIFVDAALETTSADWVDELAGPLADPEIGVVGAKLFDRTTQTIRHCGLFFSVDGEVQSMFAGERDYAYGCFGGDNWYRNWLAVSGSCFSTTRRAFDEAGGFSTSPGCGRPDIEYCLKVYLKLGRRALYNPFVRMWQLRPALMESAGGCSPDWFRARFPEGDPYFNPNVSSNRGRIELRNPVSSGRERDYNYTAEARALVQAFDTRPGGPWMPPASIRRTKTFTWFLPAFNNSFYGGVHTILRFAGYFQREHGITPRFVILGHRDPARAADQIRQVSERLAAAAEIVEMTDVEETRRLPESDAAFATLWTTAYAVRRYERTAGKFYFLQDYESLFYPAGSTSALVEATYRFGFHGIANTRPVLEAYKGYGGDGEYFEPAIDPEVFHARREGGERPGRPYTLFCYARPGHPRNCFELLAESLRRLKRRLGSRVTIVTAGERWDPQAYGLDGVVENLGLLHYRNTGALYRSMDAGVMMMMTWHPSYLPLELMACGSLVVTNKNPHTAWLLEDGVNCLLADTTPGAVADAIEEGLRNETLRRRITEAALETVRRNYSNWDAQAERAYQYIQRCTGAKKSK